MTTTADERVLVTHDGELVGHYARRLTGAEWTVWSEDGRVLQAGDRYEDYVSALRRQYGIALDLAEPPSGPIGVRDVYAVRLEGHPHTLMGIPLRRHERGPGCPWVVWGDRFGASIYTQRQLSVL